MRPRLRHVRLPVQFGLPMLLQLDLGQPGVCRPEPGPQIGGGELAGGRRPGHATPPRASGRGWPAAPLSTPAAAGIPPQSVAAGPGLEQPASGPLGLVRKSGRSAVPPLPVWPLPRPAAARNHHAGARCRLPLAQVPSGRPDSAGRAPRPALLLPRGSNPGPPRTYEECSAGGPSPAATSRAPSSFRSSPAA
jgi:hypothetical protein